MNKRGYNRPKGAPALPGAGRKPTKATITAGVLVMVSQAFPHGFCDLGRGIVSKVNKLESGNRCIIIPQKDGSELRIVIAVD